MIDKKHQKKLQALFPYDFKYKYEKLDRLNQLVSEMTHFEIIIGNTYRIINNPNDKKDKKSRWNTWKCFIRMSNDSMNKYLPFLIEKIHFKPYFREDINQKTINMNIHDKDVPALELPYTGKWQRRSYDIPIDIYFRKCTGLETPYPVIHQLVFTGNGKWHGHLFELNRKRWESIRNNYDRLHGDPKRFKDYSVNKVDNSFSYDIDVFEDKSYLSTKW